MRFFSTDGFTLIELMVAAVLFTVGFASAFLLLQSSIDLSTSAKNEILAGNHLREQHELVKNVRDSNWIRFRHWDSVAEYMIPSTSGARLEPWYYTVEHDFASAHAPVSIEKLPHDFDGMRTNILSDMNASDSRTRLCLDSLDRYVHDCADSATTPTPYARFFRVEELATRDGASVIAVDDAWRLTFFFVSTERGYREYSFSTILTDWRP